MYKATALSPHAAASDIADRWSAPTRARSAHHAAAAYATDQLHPGVYGLAIASYGAMLMAFWLAFATDVETSLSLVICAVYFVMFFGTPLIMYRVARKAAPGSMPASLGRFLRGDLETITGRIGGWAALAQVLVIPVSVTFGVTAIGLIFKTFA